MERGAHFSRPPFCRGRVSLWPALAFPTLEGISRDGEAWLTCSIPCLPGCTARFSFTSEFSTDEPDRSDCLCHFRKHWRSSALTVLTMFLYISRSDLGDTISLGQILSKPKLITGIRCGLTDVFISTLIHQNTWNFTSES